jgi:hypothetical protein
MVSPIRRRELILCLAGVIAADAARAQQKAMPLPMEHRSGGRDGAIIPRYALA